MSHLEDRLAEFVFEELTEPEMATVRQHVAQCLECQGRVSSFRTVQHSLEQLPDVEVPRRMVFLPSATESKSSGWLWKWGVPAAIAAVLMLAVLLSGSLRFERNPSGYAVVLGPVNDAGQTVESQPGVAAVPVSPTIDYASLDYTQIADRIREDIRAEQESWFRSEIDMAIGSLQGANDREIQRVRAELQYLSELQRVAQKEYYQNASHIQLLAARTGGNN